MSKTPADFHTQLRGVALNWDPVDLLARKRLHYKESYTKVPTW